MVVNLIAVIISFLSSAFLFRGLWSDRFIGEIFDTRLMIVLHEHWFRFFSGKATFLDAGFFYPYPRSFALTDTFLLTGITHSIIRFLGFEIIDSWVISQIIWVFIGLIGWYLLAKKIFKSSFLQLITIPLIATSFPFVAHLNERPNVTPYLLISLVFVAIFNFYTSQNSKIYSIHLGLVLVFVPLIVLTSWYAGFFATVYIAIFLIISLILRASYLKIALIKIRNLNFFYFTPLGLIAIFLTTLWGYIYLPELENSAEVARPKTEVINGSPSFIDLFNNSALNGSLFTIWPNTSYELMEENKIGIGIVPILLFLFIVILLWKNVVNKISSASRVFLISTIIAGIFIEIVILKFNNSSIFIFLFDNISFLKAIRTPVRWHIYFVFLLLILIVYFLDKVAYQKSWIQKFLLFSIPIFLLLDQQRTAPGLWERSEFLDQNLIAYKNGLNKCTAFVLDRPETGYWSDMIQSLALSIYVNKPTVNGYSGSVPKNYPSFDWYADGNLTAMGNWLKENDALAGVCLLDGFNVQNIPKFDSNSVELFPGSGFTGIEKSKTSTWSWSVWEKSSFFIQNFKSTAVAGNLTFTLELPECLNSANFEIRGRNIYKDVSLSGEQSIEVQFPMNLAEWERVKISISKDPGYCQIPGDPRDLHFSVKNVILREFN